MQDTTRFLLLFGSVTGKAESIAELIAEEAAKRGFHPDLKCLDQVGIGVRMLGKILNFLIIFDPLGRSTVTASSDHYMYVRPHFSKFLKTKQTSSGMVIAAGGTVDLAEGIIDDTFLVLLIF